MLPAFIAPTSGALLPSSRSPFYHDARRHLFFTSPKTKMPRLHRARLSEKYRRMNEKICYSHVTVGQLPAFEDAGVDVARKFVKDEEVLDKVEWDREEELDSLAQELVDLHGELQGALAAREATSAPQEEGRRVEHLGHGVYVQYNVYALDLDQEKSRSTITCDEHRSAAFHALDALQDEFKVAVTGQPGIGKTRGSMMYAIQYLLYRRAAVLYVGYKSKKMLLFLPREDGKYRVWRTESDDFSKTRFHRDGRVVAIIDPPEEGPYSSMGECRILKFVSNNAEKHFRNWEKDGILLVTCMPTMKEVVAMTTVLWNEETTPHPWQMGELNTLEEKREEVEKRIELVGAIPRLVFNSDLFEAAIKECVSGAVRAAGDVSDSELYQALRGKYSPYLAKHPSSATSRLFFLNPGSYHHKTWRGRRRHWITLQLTPIAAHILRDRLSQRIVVARKLPFEDLAYNVLCERMGLQPDTDHIEEKTHEEGFRRLVSLQPEAGVLFRPGACNFPMIDFASRISVWYNAKSADPEKKTVAVEHKGSLRFLREMDRYMRKVYSLDEIDEILKCDPPTLTVVTNSDFRARLDKEVELRLFDVAVRIEVMNLRDETPEKLEDGMDRTKKLLQEWDQRQLRQR